MNMAEYPPSRSDLYLRIDQNLDDEERVDLRNYVASRELLPRRGLRGMGPHQIFMKLENNRKLKTGDLSLLEDLMKKIGREDLAEEANQIAEREREDTRNHSRRSSDTEERSAPSTSSEERDNIYYKFVERSEKVFHKDVLQDPEKFTLAVEAFKLHADTVLGTIESDSGDSDIQKISKMAKLTIRRKVKNEVVRVDDQLFTDQILSDLSKYNLLVRSFNRFGAILKRATRGCVLCYIDFEDNCSFETFMQAYKIGSLSETLTQELITEDIRAAEGEDLWVHVTLLEEEEEDMNTVNKATEKAPSVDKELGTLTIMETTRNNSSEDAEKKLTELDGKCEEERKKEDATEAKCAATIEWLAREKALRELQTKLEDAGKAIEKAKRQAAKAKRQAAKAKRRAVEEKAKRQAAEVEAKRQAAEAEAKRQAAEAERQAAEAEAKRQAAKAEKHAAEAEAKRQAAVAEAARQEKRAAEERARRKTKRKFLGIF